MGHCKGCKGFREMEGKFEDCPGCGHEEEIETLRAKLASQESLISAALAVRNAERAHDAWQKFAGMALWNDKDPHFADGRRRQIALNNAKAAYSSSLDAVAEMREG